MLAGGVTMLGESRLDHVQRLRAGGIQTEVMLLRMPALSEADAVIALTHVSLNSEIATVRALSQAAVARGARHRVVLMIETGDRREGVMPEDAVGTARAMRDLPGIELLGVGTNVACIGGVHGLYYIDNLPQNWNGVIAKSDGVGGIEVYAYAGVLDGVGDGEKYFGRIAEIDVLPRPWF